MAADTARVVLHIDVDCFYAQVEENRRPALRGRPLAVTQKYLCVTANYAARERGVAKMMGVAEAKRACPELVLVPGEDLTPYRQASKRIGAVLAEFGVVERLGMDEMALDITPRVAAAGGGAVGAARWQGHVFRGSGEQLQAESHRRPTDLRVTAGSQQQGQGQEAPRDEAEERLARGSAVAAELRRAVLTRAGYTCSCGIAHNKLLAKLACGLHKPDQQTALPAAQAADLISPLPVRVLGGVGHKTARLLAGLAVHAVVRARPSHSRVASEPNCPCPLHAVLLSPSPPRLSQSELRLTHVAARVMQGDLRGIDRRLESTCGAPLAQSLREACWGRDAAPVKPRGPPASLTVEDSFKRCGSYEEARAVLRRLVRARLATRPACALPAPFPASLPSAFPS